MEPSHEITVLLEGWKAGKREAFEELVSIAYPRLRSLAEAFLRGEAAGHTLQATALVHEVYLGLVQQRKVEFADRTHFFSFAATMMRLILRNWARDKRALKRGGGAAVRIPLSDDLNFVQADVEGILDVDRALAELEQLDPRKAKIVELKTYLGCSTQEAAELLEMSKATADRDLRFAKTWLFRRLHGPGAGG